MQIQIYVVYLQSRMRREHSSVGSERLPYKQRVGGSTPSAPTKKAIQETESLFSYYPPQNPRPSATRRHQPRIAGRSFEETQDGDARWRQRRHRRAPRGCREATGGEGKTKITCHGNMPYTLLRGTLVWQVHIKSPHLPALSPAESHRRQVRMAGDFRVRLAGGLWGFAG